VILTDKPDFIASYIVDPHHEPNPLYLIIKRSAKAKILPGIWQMVTGKLESEETAPEGCLREMKEETGISTDTLYSVDVTWFCDHLSGRLRSSANYCAYVNRHTEVRLSPSEHSNYEWVTFEEASKRLVFPSQVTTLRHIHEHFVLNRASDLNLIKQ